MGGFKFNNDGKLLMEQKVLEPYFISNQTKLHFKDSGQRSQKQSLLDIIRVYKCENLDNL